MPAMTDPQPTLADGRVLRRNGQERTGNPCLDGTFVKQAMSLTGDDSGSSCRLPRKVPVESLQADQKRPSKNLARDIFSVLRLRATFRLRHSTRGLVSVPESKVPEP